jgi:hypothetical protein
MISDITQLRIGQTVWLVREGIVYSYKICELSTQEWATAGGNKPRPFFRLDNFKVGYIPDPVHIPASGYYTDHAEALEAAARYVADQIEAHEARIKVIQEELAKAKKGRVE